LKLCFSVRFQSVSYFVSGVWYFIQTARYSFLILFSDFRFDGPLFWLAATLKADIFSYLLSPISTTPSAISKEPTIFCGACDSFSQMMPSMAEITMLTSRAATT